MSDKKKTHKDNTESVGSSSQVNHFFNGLDYSKDNIPKTHSPSGSTEINYLSTEALKRPLDIPAKIKTFSMVFIIIAVVIGCIFLFFYYDKVLNAPAHEQEALQESLSKNIALDLPDLKRLVLLDDASIMSELAQSGDTLYERVPVGSGTSFEVIKLPEDVSLVDAGSMYLRGINNLTVSEVVKLLNGSWDLNVNRESGINMSIHYADFKSGSSEAALHEAIVSEGFEDSENADSGTDSAGNTYSTGTIDLEGTSYTWRVSALPLSEVYSMTGIPSDASYVGIRISG